MVFKEKLQAPDYSELLKKEQVGNDELVEVAEVFEDRLRGIVRRVLDERNDNEDGIYDYSIVQFKREVHYKNALEVQNALLYIVAAFCVFFWYSRNSQYLVWIDVAVILPSCFILLVSGVTQFFLVRYSIPSCAPKGLVVFVFASTVMTIHHIYNILQNDSALIFIPYTGVLALMIIFAKKEYDKLKNVYTRNLTLPSIEPELNA